MCLVGGVVAEDLVGKFFAIVGKYFFDLKGKALCNEFQELSGIPSGLRFPELYTDHSSGSINADDLHGDMRCEFLR